jgi:hypothetical protein
LTLRPWKCSWRPLARDRVGFSSKFGGKFVASGAFWCLLWPRKVHPNTLYCFFGENRGCCHKENCFCHQKNLSILIQPQFNSQDSFKQRILVKTTTKLAFFDKTTDFLQPQKSLEVTFTGWEMCTWNEK